MVPEKLQEIVNDAYALHRPKWQTVRDALEGEVTIKGHNTRYLPMPSAMLLAENQSPSFQYDNEIQPYDRHPSQPYSAYKQRARFPEVTDATLRGIIGLIQRNPSAYTDLPYEDFAQNCTKDRKSLQEFELLLNTEVMSVGRAGILADPDERDGKIKLVLYKTEAILNWQTIGTAEDIEYTGVLLQDDSTSANFWDSSTSYKKHLLLFLDENGIYTVAKYINYELQEIIQPSYKGRTLNKIPLVIVGTVDLTADIDTPPLWPLANLAVKIYQTTADLRQAQYMTCNPTLVITGADPDTIPKAIGSNVAMVFPDPETKVYYPKTDTSALDHIRLSIKDMLAEAIRLGANLLGNDNSLAESGEAIRLRQSMAAATVAAVVATTGKGLTRCLNFINEWIGQDKQSEILVNKEFSSFQMTANEQIALVQSWQAGAISTVTMLENFRRAGMLQEGQDPEAELENLLKDTYLKEQLKFKAELKDKQSKRKGPDGGLPAGSQPDTRIQ